MINKKDLENLVKGYNAAFGLNEYLRQDVYDMPLRETLGSLFGNPNLYKGVPADAVRSKGDELVKDAETKLKNNVTYEDFLKNYKDPREILTLLSAIPYLKGKGEIAEAHKKFYETLMAYKARKEGALRDPIAYQNAIRDSYGPDKSGEFKDKALYDLAASGSEFAGRVDELDVMKAKVVLYEAIKKVKPEKK